MVTLTQIKVTKKPAATGAQLTIGSTNWRSGAPLIRRHHGRYDTKVPKALKGATSVRWILSQRHAWTQLKSREAQPRIGCYRHGQLAAPPRLPRDSATREVDGTNLEGL